METLAALRKAAAQKKFKSYYVVWKHKNIAHANKSFAKV